MIAGDGEKKTLRLVARYADACSLRPAREIPRKLEVLRHHCEAEGREYEEIEKTCAFAFDVGEEGEKVERAGRATCAGSRGWASRPSSAWSHTWTGSHRLRSSAARWSRRSPNSSCSRLPVGSLPLSYFPYSTKGCVTLTMRPQKRRESCTRGATGTGGRFEKRSLPRYPRGDECSGACYGVLQGARNATSGKPVARRFPRAGGRRGLAGGRAMPRFEARTRVGRSAHETRQKTCKTAPLVARSAGLEPAAF